jgi:hypothetical protein
MLLVFVLKFLIGICLLFFWRFGDVYILCVFLCLVILTYFWLFVGRVEQLVISFLASN